MIREWQFQLKEAKDYLHRKINIEGRRIVHLEAELRKEIEKVGEVVDAKKLEELNQKLADQEQINLRHHEILMEEFRKQ